MGSKLKKLKKINNNKEEKKMATSTNSNIKVEDILKRDRVMIDFKKAVIKAFLTYKDLLLKDKVLRSMENVSHDSDKQALKELYWSKVNSDKEITNFSNDLQIEQDRFEETFGVKTILLLTAGDFEIINSENGEIIFDQSRIFDSTFWDRLDYKEFLLKNSINFWKRSNNDFSEEEVNNEEYEYELA